MLKIFLVEDEIVMREGIRKNIDWMEEGFDFVGEASDGELAYPMIQKKKPDILITDIKMPFMDGLELSRLVRKELPETKIILLSGYDEFEYAKEAIEIGITEYLVKPVTSVQLVDAVKKVKEIIQKDCEKKAELEQKGKSEQEQKIAARQKLFRRMISGKTSFSSLMEESREIGEDLMADSYNILLLQLFLEEESDAVFSAVQNLLEQLKKTEQINIFEQGRDEIAILLKETEDKSLEGITKKLETLLEQAKEQEQKIDYFAAMGNPVERLSDLKKCYEEANLEFSHRYTMERNQIICAKEQIKKEQSGEEELDLGNLKVSYLERRKLEQFLATGTKEEVSDCVETHFKSIGEQNIQSLLYRQYIIMDFYVIAAGFLEQLGYKSRELADRCGDTREMATVLGTVEQTKDYIKKLFAVAIELREQTTIHKYESVLKKAKNFMEENYEKDEISLNTVAAEVNLSPSHFSTIFGQEMGETFIEHLTRIRMEKAKELLRTTNMRTTDIAYEVGYRDAHYFSNLFKKTQGCTPREYRNR